MKNIKKTPLQFIDDHRAVIIAIFSILINLLGFIFVLNSYDTVFATNDDYRMRSIASGAYTGSPSPYLVFMKYPIGWLLSFQYTLLPEIPWYGIFIILCYFVPCCILLYFLLTRSKDLVQYLFSFTFYLAFFYFIVQKHIVFTQFTTASAFLAAGALLILFYFNEVRDKKSIIINCILFTVLCGLSICVRMKVFFLFLPIMGFILIWDVVNEKKERKKYIALIASAAAFCIILSGIDFISLNTKQYQNFVDFNTGRSQIYDYYKVPDYNNNKNFYNSIGVDQAVYRAILARYLDVDPQINTETYDAIINHQKAIVDAKPLSQRISLAIVNTPLYYFAHYNSAVRFETGLSFTFVLAGIIFCLIKKKSRQSYILFCVVPIIFAEICFLLLEGRIMDRIVEALAIQMSFLALGSLQTSGAFSNYYFPHITADSRILKTVLNTIAVGSITFVIIFSAVSCQRCTASILNSANIRQEYLTLLNAYTQNNPDAYIFYDTYDFISASASVFSYDDNALLKTESLGNWNVKSPDYYKRMKKLNAESSIDALLNNGNVYYAAISTPKLGMSLLLSRKYDCKLVKCDSINGSCFSISLFRIVKIT